MYVIMRKEEISAKLTVKYNEFFLWRCSFLTVTAEKTKFIGGHVPANWQTASDL